MEVTRPAPAPAPATAPASVNAPLTRAKPVPAIEANSGLNKVVAASFARIVELFTLRAPHHEPATAVALANVAPAAAAATATSSSQANDQPPQIAGSPHDPANVIPQPQEQGSVNNELVIAIGDGCHARPTMVVPPRYSQLWTQEIRERLESEIKQCFGTDGILELCMVTDKSGRTGPCILLTLWDETSGPDPKARAKLQKKLQKRFRALETLKKYKMPGKVIIDKVSLAARVSRSEDLPGTVWTRTLSPNSGTCMGLPLTTRESSGNGFVLGGLLRIGSQSYGLTVAHPFLHAAAVDEPVTLADGIDDHQSSGSASEEDIQSDSDSLFDGFEDCLSETGSSVAQGAKGQGLAHSQPDLTHVEPPQRGPDLGVSSNAFPFRFGRLHSMSADDDASFNPSPVQLTHDWALIELDDRIPRLPNTYRRGASQQEAITIDHYSTGVPMAGTAVIIIDGHAHTQAVIGQADIKLNIGKLRLTVVQVVTPDVFGMEVISASPPTLTARLGQGVSGSWVVQGNHVLGYLVAVRRFMSISYMIPMHRAVDELAVLYPGSTVSFHIPGRANRRRVVTESDSATLRLGGQTDTASSSPTVARVKAASTVSRRGSRLGPSTTRSADGRSHISLLHSVDQENPADGGIQIDRWRDSLGASTSSEDVDDMRIGLIPGSRRTLPVTGADASRDHTPFLGIVATQPIDSMTNLSASSLVSAPRRRPGSGPMHTAGVTDLLDMPKKARGPRCLTWSMLPWRLVITKQFWQQASRGLSDSIDALVGRLTQTRPPRRAGLKYGWVAVSMRAPYLLALIVLAIALAVVQEVVLRKLDQKVWTSDPPSNAYVLYVRYIPAIITLGYAWLVSRTYYDTCRLEPFFHLLNRPDPRGILDGLTLRYQSYNLLTVPVRALLYGHGRVLCISVAMSLCQICTPVLAARAFTISFPTTSTTGGYDGRYQLLINSVLSRVLSVVYGVVALAIVAHLWLMARTRPALQHDIRTIAGICALTADTDALRDRLLQVNAKLPPRAVHDALVYQADRDREWEPGIMRYLHRLRKRLRGHARLTAKVTGIMWFGMNLELLVFLFVYLIVGVINRDRHSTSRLTKYVSWLPILAATLLKTSWTRFASDMLAREPYTRLIKGRSRAADSLCMDYETTNAFVSLYRARGRRHWIVAITSASSILSYVLLVLVASLSADWTRFRSSDNDPDLVTILFWTCSIIALVILTLLVAFYVYEVASRAYAIRTRQTWFTVPRDVGSLVFLVCGSYMLTKFRGLIQLDEKKLRQALQPLGDRAPEESYGVGIIRDINGHYRVAIDADPFLKLRSWNLGDQGPATEVFELESRPQSLASAPFELESRPQSLMFAPDDHASDSEAGSAPDVPRLDPDLSFSPRRYLRLMREALVEGYLLP